jgi:RNA polymerase sigma-70 factor, ECF subfamily
MQASTARRREPELTHHRRPPPPPGSRHRPAAKLAPVVEPTPASSDDPAAREVAVIADELARARGELARRIEAAAQAWPAIQQPPAVFLRHLAAGVVRRNPADRQAYLAGLRLDDLYLACGCLAGDAGALRALEPLLASIATIVRFIGTEPAFVDDVRAVVAEDLLIAGPRPQPKLALYSGEGSLRSWFTVVVQRVALNLRRAGAGTVPLASLDDLSGLLQGRLEPELELLKARFVPELQAAMREAIAQLSRRERIILRLSMVQGVSMRQIAASYQVNQSTVSRWIGRALDVIHEGVRRSLRERCRLGASEVDSLIDAVRSRVDVSLAGLLATDGSRPTEDNDGLP